jgi:hypothetical protein
MLDHVELSTNMWAISAIYRGYIFLCNVLLLLFYCIVCSFWFLAQNEISAAQQDPTFEQT